MRRWQQITLAGVGMLVVTILVSSAAFAQYSSTNYQTNEVFFGSGGELNTCSTGPTGYCAKDAVGELGVGNSASTNYQVQAGFNTTEQPFLEFVVTGSNIDLGYLNTGSVTTATGTFSVRAWNSGGYVVKTQSNPPTSNAPGSHVMAAPSSPTASAPGTEQFGINLVANTSPSIAGSADPAQVPNSTFSFGAAATGYNTTNQFKYVKGDTVALSTKSTSITNYTVSYIFNISTSTPSGKYTFTHILVATATY